MKGERRGRENENGKTKQGEWSKEKTRES